MKKLWALFLILLLVALISGCQPDTTVNSTKQEFPVDKKTTFMVNHINTDGTSLVRTPITKKIDESAPQTALNTLLIMPDTNNFYNPLAKANVKLLSLDMKGDLAIVNFSHEIKTIKGSSLQELLLVGSIVNTLTEFKEIKQVQILVDGRRVESLLGHLDLSVPLKRDESIMYKQSK